MPDDAESTVMDAISASGASRTRRLLSGVGTSILSRGVAALAPLVVIPLTLSYLGEEVFGLWMTVMAIAAMAAFADLGLGFGLMTKLAPCHAANDDLQARRYISSAYAVLGALAVTATAALWLLAPHLPWARLLNARTPLGDSVSGSVALIVLTSFIVSIPLGIIARIQYAYQRVAQSNMWQAAGSLLSVALVLAATKLQLAPVAVVAASAFAVPVTYLLNSVWFFARQRPGLAPRVRFVDREQGIRLMRLGGLFFILTAIISMAVNVDNLIIARTLGPASVAQFATLARLFGALGVIVSLVNVPLWPTAGEALARGDIAWVRRTTRVMTLVSFSAVAVPGTVLVIAGRRVMETWLPHVDYFTTALALGLTLWWLSQSTISPRFMVQNSAAILRPQLIGWSAFALISIPLKWYASGRWGIAAIPVVGATVYLATVVPSAMVGYRLAISSAKRGEGE